MKIYTIILLSIIPVLLTAQTTIDEYEYLTAQYPEQIAKSEIPEKAGYYFQDLMNMVDNSGKVRLFYKESQTSVVPIATLILVNGNDKIFYICVPHDDSDRFVFDKYADDLQKLFETDEKARANYSKIMFRYPKQIQKYYDEISALENGLSTPITATTTDKGSGSADITSTTPEAETKTETKTETKIETEPVAKPKLTVIEQPKEEKPAPKVDIEKEPKVKIPPKETVTLKEVDRATTTSKTASQGIATAKVRSSLAYRQLLYRPEILNETDKYGVIRVDVCVNNKGQVISANYNKSDSDTKDKDLVMISERLAKKYAFEKSHLSRQCGFIIFKYQFQ